MLSTLNIRNFVIVEKLELDFQNGFSALTGETGAGKSILIDAIQLLFGSRSDAGLIREGADKSDLSASFTTTAPSSVAGVSFRLPPKEPTAVRQQLTTYTSFIAVNLQIVISFSPHTEKYPSALIIPLRF